MHKSPLTGDSSKPPETVTGDSNGQKGPRSGGNAPLAISGNLRRFSMDSGSDNNAKRCQLCMFNVQLGGSDLKGCQHRNQGRYVQWMAGGKTVGGDCYSHQKTYNVYTRYQGNASLLSANRRAIKSMSNIDDAFGSSSNVQEGLFGEKISSSRPNTLVVNEKDIRSDADSASNYSRQLSVPNTITEIQQFTNFAAISASENATKKTSCNVCGICNQNRCTSANKTSGGMINSSRFTITTLSRNGSSSHNCKSARNPTLPRNGGVLIAVRDWSNNANCETKTQLPSLCGDPSLQDSYYEILKNPNNNASPAYENSAIIGQGLADLEQKQPVPPIYAVVNKLNKSKNKQPYTAVIEPTKYTYIGMSPNAKFNKDTNDSLYATIRKAPPNCISNAAVNNNNVVIAGATNPSRLDNLSMHDRDSVPVARVSPMAHNDGNNSHITITSSVDTPGAETSEIYAKVWKGPRKSLDSQKMYVYVVCFNGLSFIIFLVDH